jgi:hypothetical protein
MQVQWVLPWRVQDLEGTSAVAGVSLDGSPWSAQFSPEFRQRQAAACLCLGRWWKAKDGPQVHEVLSFAVAGFGQEQT